MKTQFTQRFVITLIAAIVLTISHSYAQKVSEDELRYRDALHKQLVDGDLNGAIKIYQNIIASKTADPATKANALLHLALAYEDLGQEASSLYQQVVREFPGQLPAKQAAAKLAAVQSSSGVAAASKGLMKVAGPINAGRGLGAAVSPDGRYLYVTQDVKIPLLDLVTKRTWFAHPSGDAQYVGLPPSAGTPLVGGPEGAFSVDGKQFAYFLANGPFAVSTVGELRTIKLPLSGAPGKLVFRSEEFVWITPFGWSRDGRDIFALLTRKDKTSVIAAVSATNGSHRPIKSLDWRWPSKLSLSPDGRYIVYDAPVARQSTNRDIFLLSVDGRESTLVESPMRDAAPLWAPDSSAVLFTSHNPSVGATLLSMIAVSDGKPRGSVQRLPFQSDVGLVWPIGFSRDGSFYYQYQTPFRVIGHIGTAEIDLDSGAMSNEVRIPGLGGGEYAAAYSPDGKRIAYFSQTGSGFRSDSYRSRGFLTLVIRTLASGAEQRFPTPLTRAISMTWLPNELSAVAVADDEHYSQASIYRIDPNTGAILSSRPGLTPTGSSHARTSPEGTRVYLVSAPRLSKLISYETGSDRQTVLFEGNIDTAGGPQLALSPDGRQIAFLVSQGTNRALHIMPSSGGRARVLTLTTLPGRMSIIDWSPAGDHVRVQTLAGALWRIPVDGGQPERIGTGNYPRIQAIRPDGKQLLTSGETAVDGFGLAVWVDPQAWNNWSKALAARGR